MEENRKKLHNSSINTIKIILIIILFLIIFSIALLIYYEITKITNETNDNSNNIQTGNNYSVSNEPLRKENITQEEGIELAKQFLTNIGYDKETIKTVEIQKLSNSREEDYKIITNSNLEVLVDINKGKVNSFFDNNNYTVNQTSLDEDEAKTVLLEKYDVLKGENDYELVSFEKESNDVWTGYFNKKYGELYNKYQGITLKIIPELDKIVTVAYFDEEFEDTEIIVSKEDAINIAKNKIEFNNIESINAYLSIEKSNLFVETLEDINFDEKNLEDTNYIVRKVWRVDIKQNNNLNILSFFVDVETGEIIGGDGIR